MGVWGTGTFESDAGGGYLDDLVERICVFIRDDLVKAETDGVLERETIAAIACLRAVISQNVERELARQILSVEEVIAWSKTYLDWFDRNADGTGVSREMLKVMRLNVQDEFDRLLDCLR